MLTEMVILYRKFGMIVNCDVKESGINPFYNFFSLSIYLQELSGITK